MVFGKAGNEMIISDASCLGKAIHSLEHNGVDASAVIYILVQVVLLPEFLWDGLSVEPNVFRFREVVIKVKILNIDARRACSWGTDDKVE